MRDKKRRAEIIKVAKQCSSYAEAGRQLEISRERVRQVARHRIPRPPEGYELLAVAARRLGYSVDRLGVLARVGAVPILLRQGRRYVKTSEFYLGACELCGKPLDKGRFVYCSEKCLEEGQRRSHMRVMWRNLRRLKGDKVITLATAYRERKSHRVTAGIESSCRSSYTIDEERERGRLREQSKAIPVVSRSPLFHKEKRCN